jgi:hypothetical protein
MRTSLILVVLALGIIFCLYTGKVEIDMFGVKIIPTIQQNPNK